MDQFAKFPPQNGALVAVHSYLTLTPWQLNTSYLHLPKHYGNWSSKTSSMIFPQITVHFLSLQLKVLGGAQLSQFCLGGGVQCQTLKTPAWIIQTWHYKQIHVNTHTQVQIHTCVHAHKRIHTAHKRDMPSWNLMIPVGKLSIHMCTYTSTFKYKSKYINTDTHTSSQT